MPVVVLFVTTIPAEFKEVTWVDLGRKSFESPFFGETVEKIQKTVDLVSSEKLWEHLTSPTLNSRKSRKIPIFI